MKKALNVRVRDGETCPSRLGRENMPRWVRKGETGIG